ncbi:MAG: HEPN domain-containing protein [Deltaproteobacteria bacterium]|nr:HEPN domain-containing protein [Deltaproteobacteria bacterium]MBW2153968.1 HEPN domain-containing protein [Deltaproteobacteria bacterium]
MIDINKQIEFWCEAAKEDWEVASDLVDRNRVRHGLFFAHLALEKALKAHVCLVTQDLAPRLHNLIRLSEIAELSLNPDQLDVLAEMNAFNIEGRYPDTLSPPPDKKQALEYIAKSKKVFQWLIDQL